VGHQVNLVLLETRAQVIRHGQCIRYQLVFGQRAGGSIRVEGDAAATLLPPANDESVLKNDWIAVGDGKLRHARAAVQKKQHRLGLVLAPDEHPLFHAVDRDGEFL
jgi:hypothetical protein